jgi:ribosomal protein S18 acetylase RimI-like enzyme
MALTLRPAHAADFEFFYDTRRAGFRGFVEQAFGAWLDAEQRALAEREFHELPPEIIDRDGAPIGYRVVVRHADHWFLDEIVLVDCERGRGLGTSLIRSIMTAASAAGMPLRLSVLDVNPAQRLYARLGFRVTRTEPPRVKMEWP